MQCLGCRLENCNTNDITSVATLDKKIKKENATVAIKSTYSSKGIVLLS